MEVMMRKKVTRLIVSIMFYSFLGIALLTAVNCGGGGGGGGEQTSMPVNYSGTWRVPVTLALNDCNLSNISQSNTATNIVSHSSNNVVVVSGTATLTGNLNDKDGFDVYGPVYTQTYGTVNCAAQAGIRYEGASDGVADAILAAIAECGGVQCIIAYKGIATRQNNSTALVEESHIDDTVSTLLNSCGRQISSLDNVSKDTSVDENALTQAVSAVLNDHGRK